MSVEVFVDWSRVPRNMCNSYLLSLDEFEEDTVWYTIDMDVFTDEEEEPEEEAYWI